MTDQTKVTIDDREFLLDDLSDAAKNVTVRRTRSGEVKDLPVTLLEQRNARGEVRRYG